MTEMTAEGLQVPPGGATTEPPVAEGLPEEEDQRRRRRRKAFLLLFLLGLLAMLVTIATWYLIFRQPIVPPLPVIPESQIPGYSTAIYGAQRPVGVAVSPSGDRIYVTQTSGPATTLVFDGGGNRIGEMAPPATTAAEHVPVYVAIDPITSEVYVSDRQAGAIYVYDRDGLFQRTFTLASPRPGWQPLGLTFDKSGFLYVTDLSGSAATVLVIDRQAQVVRTMGEGDGLAFPNGLAVTDGGDVFVADSNNGRLLLYGSDGTIRAQASRASAQGNLAIPRGLAIDGSGRLFVADTTGHAVLVYREPGDESSRLEYLGLFGAHGVADGQFSYPGSVAVDARGRVYVADTQNDRVQIWSY